VKLLYDLRYTDIMDTAADRMQYAKEMCDIWASNFRIEEDLNHSHPGALDNLFKHFTDESEGELEEGMDQVLEFHRVNTFTVDDGKLYVEFPYETLLWDTAQNEWVVDGDGEPYFKD
jgi:hypothetical protein